MIRSVNDSLTISNRLRPVLLRLARHLRREIHSIGVTGGQVTLLVAIKAQPGITARELADRERISAAGMSGQLVRLEATGLIRRERAADRRRIGLFVTDNGDRVLRSVKKKRTAWLAARLDRLTDTERAAVEAALPALERLLDEEPAV
jgi:DNA-binding MarR family transcriptional regulator